ncbi:hypothetical protein F383_12217 [Gossypium arboreum]|uniref:Uncharacterized protein n=1 Tax=Gossypium arboreum TaxID=29729 RepID=A0A0B0PYG1_GOSAR|nr:hypothetical protein F383_12217 [Gossypium arboreum]
MLQYSFSISSSLLEAQFLFLFFS